MPNRPRQLQIGCIGLVLCAVFLSYLLQDSVPAGHVYSHDDYFTPLGAKPGSVRSFWLKWNDGKPIPGSSDDSGRDWTKEKYIWFDGCVTPQAFEVLRQAPDLEILRISRLGPTEVCSFTGIDNLTNLRTLSISGPLGPDCELADCPALARCKSLTYLQLDAIKLSERNVQEIAASKSLELIVLDWDVRAPRGSFVHLKELQTLKGLHLEDASADTLRDLSQISQLEGISFGHCTRVKEITALAELRKISKLRQVRLCEDDPSRYPALRAALPGIKLILYTDPT